ncbi:MAG: hypothetical protein MUP09_05415 [Thiovulaceae bacterium]|nr:hypothetical protein [Sulfurimonadaceae bacterium]
MIPTTKESLLHRCDADAIMQIIARDWALLQDEEQQELCLEAIYEILAHSVVAPDNFALLSNEAKAQFELDVDMALITIDFKDIGKIIFKDKENERYFWSLIGDKDDKKSKKIVAALFS